MLIAHFRRTFFGRPTDVRRQLPTLNGNQAIHSWIVSISFKLQQSRDQKMKIIKLLFVFLLFVSFVSCAPIEEDEENSTEISLEQEQPKNDFEFGDGGENSSDYNSDEDALLLDLDLEEIDEEESSTEILTTIVSTTTSTTTTTTTSTTTTTTTTTITADRSPKIKNGPSRKEVFTLGMFDSNQKFGLDLRGQVPITCIKNGFNAS